MAAARIERLKRDLTDKYVMVESGHPALDRFKGLVGRVKTVNMSGRALVQFEGRGDLAWYDVALDQLKVVDPPPEKPPEVKPKPAPKAGAKAAAAKPTAAPPGTPGASPQEP